MAGRFPYDFSTPVPQGVAPFSTPLPPGQSPLPFSPYGGLSGSSQDPYLTLGARFPGAGGLFNLRSGTYLGPGGRDVNFQLRYDRLFGD